MARRTRGLRPQPRSGDLTAARSAGVVMLAGASSVGKPRAPLRPAKGSSEWRLFAPRDAGHASPNQRRRWWWRQRVHQRHADWHRHLPPRGGSPGRPPVRMTAIVTLTLNPAIDLSYEVDAIAPTQKLRTRAERTFPGGGGINVARVLARLGRPVTCVHLSGGAGIGGAGGCAARVATKERNKGVPGLWRWGARGQIKIRVAVVLLGRQKAPQTRGAWPQSRHPRRFGPGPRGAGQSPARPRPGRRPGAHPTPHAAERATLLPRPWVTRPKGKNAGK